MIWVGVLAGIIIIIIGLALGMVVTFAIVIDSKMNDLEEK